MFFITDLQAGCDIALIGRRRHLSSTSHDDGIRYPRQQHHSSTSLIVVVWIIAMHCIKLLHRIGRVRLHQGGSDNPSNSVASGHGTGPALMIIA